MRGAVVAWVLLVATGCRYTATFTCETSDQCVARTGPGICQLPAGLCSFADATCPMGQRYDDTAGDVAGECVGEAPMIDAAVPFDPNLCPVGFTQLATSSESRYRVLPAPPPMPGMSFGDYLAPCTMQAPGLTHAAVIDTATEATAVAMAIAAGGTTGQVYIGVVQDPAATTPGAGWIHADGSAVLATLWASNEPNDGNGTEADHLEQVAVLTPTSPFNDNRLMAGIPVLCECDGRGPAAAFTALAATTH